MNRSILGKELTVKGFVVYSHLPRWPEAFKTMGEWIDKVNDCYVQVLSYSFVCIAWTGCYKLLMQWNFLLIDYNFLMPSDKHNSITNT